MTDNKLTHFDASGNAVMVDVSEKTVTSVSYTHLTLPTIYSV